MKEHKDFPLDIQFGFHKLIERYESQLKTEKAGFRREYLQKILTYFASFPKLWDGINPQKELGDYEEPMNLLLNELFPSILSKNEIKAISAPFHNFVFHPSKKFREILKNAGSEFEFKLRNPNPDLDYIFGCIVILNSYYGYDFDFSRPLYYDIPDENGILRHYQVDIDSEFMEIFPHEKAKEISEKDVDELINNFEDIKLWKQYFPPKSWVFKGFIILNLTDVSVDDAISELKTTLLYKNNSAEEDMKRFEAIFRSIYKIGDLEVGISIFDAKKVSFERYGKNPMGFIPSTNGKAAWQTLLCEKGFKSLIEEHFYFTISNVNEFAKKNPDNGLAENLLKSGVKSVIFAPIAKAGKLLGVLELVSFEKNKLNSIDAIKLDAILPYLATAMERSIMEYENRVKAVIQNECTSIHPSVLWAFEQEARHYIHNMEVDGMAAFQDIAFEAVYPLYGQIDIVASSEARNQAIQKDLLLQLQIVKEIIQAAFDLESLPLYEQVQFRIDAFILELEENLNASSEQKIAILLEGEVHPILNHIEKQNKELSKRVKKYWEQAQVETGILFQNRKHYNEAVAQINRSMSRYLDKRQPEAQGIFPHYFERFKTDGVDHDIYMGASLQPEKHFDKIYLYNLRLWQLRTMCEMENLFYEVQENQELTLSASSLILVFNNTLSIRYRMDEKRFDIDGTYNARYEIIKKRIDKACVQGSKERLTQKGKIAIVYSQKADEREYLRYIKYLQTKKYLGSEVELLELEDVQSVIGLKAIRVKIVYQWKENSDSKVITYEDLIRVLE